MEYPTFSEYVWDTLSRIDVADHIDHITLKNGRKLTYLPWHKAWTLLKRKFPSSTYTHTDDTVHPDGTMEVGVLVDIRGQCDTDVLQSRARLAVMDSRFGAIPHPNARDINDSRQRALVKALAFAGLGLSLWDDSLIPVGKLSDPITSKQYAQLVELIDTSDTDKELFLEWAGVDELDQLPLERFSAAVQMLEAKVRKANGGKK